MIKCHSGDKLAKYDVSKRSKLIITIFCSKNNNVGTKRRLGGKFSKNKEIHRCHDMRRRPREGTPAKLLSQTLTPS